VVGLLAEFCLLGVAGSVNKVPNKEQDAADDKTVSRGFISETLIYLLIGKLNTVDQIYTQQQ
jgi:hypothetical protein